MNNNTNTLQNYKVLYKYSYLKFNNEIDFVKISL